MKSKCVIGAVLFIVSLVILLMLNRSLNQLNQSSDTNSAFSGSKIKSVVVNFANSLKRARMLRQDLESKNVPINFYGRFIDQNSNSLPGVKFHLMVRHWDVTAPNWGYSIPIDKVTDAQGHFDIHGITGDAFDMEKIEKDGYELEPGERSFGAVGGSSNHPVIFKMWRKDVHEHLITGSKHIKIIPDGRHYAVDLISGTVAETQNEEGDSQVWLTAR